jgi:hypothetical protein
MASEDLYICPAGESLTYRYTNEENGLVLRHGRSTPRDPPFSHGLGREPTILDCGQLAWVQGKGPPFQRCPAYREHFMVPFTEVRGRFEY